ncbi:MAG TPA: RNA 2',3'-cyclic phosphodiesterase [Albitalea sp.]
MQTDPSAGTSPARLFIGLWPDEGVREALIACAERWTWPPGARRVPRNKLHLTLFFLGAVPRERVAVLEQALAVPVNGFELHLQHAEVWPSEVAVLRPLAVPPGLQSLHGRLHEALAEIGMAPPRERWQPHLTLARKARWAVPCDAKPPVRWSVRGHALIESTPSSAYRVLREYA